jgi:hypothetical protein
MEKDNLKNETANSTNTGLGDVYQNRISNYKLNEGEMYCIVCNQVIKKINLNRHDNSVKHKKEVLKFVERMKANIA